MASLLQTETAEDGQSGWEELEDNWEEKACPYSDSPKWYFRNVTYMADEEQDWFLTFSSAIYYQHLSGS